MAITQSEFRKEVDDLLRERTPSLTSKQRAVLVDAVIQKEEAGGGTIRLWDYDSAFRLEHLGHVLFNLEHANPEMFAPAPSAEATFAALHAKAVEDAKGLDITHQEHPSAPGNKRALLRLVEKMSPDERIAAVDGLTLAPETSPAPETREQVEQAALEFTGPGDPRFRAWVARTYGTPEHLQLSRKNAEIYRALMAQPPQRGLDRRTLAIAETQGQSRALSPAERREQVRAQQRLARKAG